MNEGYDLEQDGGRRREKNNRQEGERNKRFNGAVLRERFDRITQNPIFIFILLALLGIALLTLFSLNTALYLQKQKNNQLVEENTKLSGKINKLAEKNANLKNKVAEKKIENKNLSDQIAQKDQELSSAKSQVETVVKKVPVPVPVPQTQMVPGQTAQPQSPQTGVSPSPSTDFQSPQQPAPQEPEYMGMIE